MFDINWHPGARHLRWFAALQLVFLGGMAWAWREHLNGTATWVVLCCSALAAVAGSIRPAMVQPLYVIWMAAAFPIGWLLNHTVLAMVYYLVLTPMAVVRRLVGDDALQRDFDAQAKTYWTKRRSDQSVERYFQQH
jgi:hypothetical protein